MNRRSFLKLLGLGAAGAAVAVLPVPVPSPRMGTPLIRTSPLVDKPIFTFTGDSDTGMYRKGDDTIGFASKGHANG